MMKSVAIRSVRVIDGTGRTIERATVVIRGTTIAAVGSERDVSLPRGAIKIDGRGLTLLPGLIDCHVHLCLGAEPDVVNAMAKETPSLTLLKSSRAAHQTLEAGVTTVRDVGSRDHSIFTLKQAIDSGLVPGPRIVGAGLAICMIGGHARFIGQEVEGVQQVRAVVREQIAAGAGVIKVIASGGVLTPGTSPDQAQMTVEELQAAVEEAQRAGRKVAAHAHGSSGMKNAVRAGVHSIEHATLMDEEAATMMKQHSVFMVPTLSALATTAACRLGCGVPDSARHKAKAMTKRHAVSFKNALRYGIRIAMGTDAGTPFNFHGQNAQELERMVAFGMSPMQAILASTSAAARLIGIQDQVGTIEKGKVADLLLFEGNPLRRIDLLRDRSRIIGVMQAGKFVAGPLSKM
ncbi:MAG: amidohydrolase family protein [Nitrospirae bacterium]|nr:amidohydrolase family protein [Nitrospirota bacterium]MDE3041053.1 amidohydrolase family protein [Nitrospirota bacterium]MDE3049645.1 amidohydrolase family protein [Nitrospirota bacterium]MDE3219113.1 amidohydrolase family protein [Nitrospirota bacterium]